MRRVKPLRLVEAGANNTGSYRVVSFYEVKTLPEWWTFFPIVGLTIRGGKGLDTAPLMFGDCTILSRKAFGEFTARNAGGKWVLPGRRYHSVIAVRRHEAISSDSSPHVVWLAHERAQQVVAALSLALLVKSDSGNTCALAEHIQDWQLVFRGFSPEKEYHTFYSGKKPYGVQVDHPLSLSPEGMLAALQSEDCKDLAALTCFQGKSSSNREAVTAATIRLASAMHLPNTSDMILGTVTAMEILLTQYGDRFDVLERRLRDFLGPDNVQSLRAKEVLQARHEYVHRGKALGFREGWLLAADAAHLGLNVLFGFARLSQRFKSKAAIISYLDFLHGADVLANHDTAITASVQRHAYAKLDLQWPSATAVSQASAAPRS